MKNNLRLSGAGAWVPVGNEGPDREYVAHMLRNYLNSIDAGLRSYAAGSDMERGYMLEKLNNLRAAIEYYL